MHIIPSPLRLFFATLLIPAALHAASVFHTDFSNYSTGALEGHPDWSINNAGNNTQWIVQQDSTNPSAPASLSGGKHPTSPLGGSHLLWLSPRTSNVTANQNAYLAFAPETERLREPFKFSMDIFASPTTSGPGQSATFYLTQSGNTGRTTAPMFSFSSPDSSTLTLSMRDSGAWSNSVATLPKDSWLRFEVDVNASTSSTGTWTLSIYSLDSSGSVTGTLFTSSPFGYSGMSEGFDTFRILTNSSRVDYWVDSIQVSTIPEPRTTALLGGGFALLLCVGLRRR